MILTVILLLPQYFTAAVASPAQERMNQDIESGQPIVIHTVVALADNKHQWIVPVPESIGNGQEAISNLYWGALYGLKTHLIKSAHWTLVSSIRPNDNRILERIVVNKSFRRRDRQVTVYLVADAWDGKYIGETIEQFFRFNAGYDSEEIEIKDQTIRAGANAHLLVYIGHNALMDFMGAKNLALKTPAALPENPVNDAVVLACNSYDYFASRLRQIDAYPLLMTHGLMAPEAYTLDAAINSWIRGDNDTQIRKASAASYSRYQKSGLKAAERLFGVK